MKQVRHWRTQAGVRFELKVPDLDLAPGEFVAVVGPSGCGKSTLLDILGLVLRPAKADIFSIQGRESLLDLVGLSQADRAAVRSRHIGYVLQTGGLLPFLTVRQNIALPLSLNKKKQTGQIQSLTRTLGISEHLDKLPGFLSGGQRQRVAIARALIHQPDLVLADEPTAAVDELTAREIRDQFRGLSQTSNTTTVMVTHDRSLIEGQVDRVFGFRLERDEKGGTCSTLYETEAL